MAEAMAKESGHDQAPREDEKESSSTPIFSLNEYCWDQIMAHLSLIDALRLEIADCRFRLAVLRKLTLIKKPILTPVILQSLIQYRHKDEFLPLWGELATQLYFQGNRISPFAYQFDEKWLQVLPNFPKVTHLYLVGVHIKSLEVAKRVLPKKGIQCLAYADSSMPPGILGEWLRTINPSLNRLEFFHHSDDHPADLKPFGCLTNIVTLVTDQFGILDQISTKNIQTMNFPRHPDLGMRYLDEDQWEKIVKSPELQRIYIGYTCIPSLEGPASPMDQMLMRMGQRFNVVKPPPLRRSKLTVLHLDAKCMMDSNTANQLVNLKYLKLSGIYVLNEDIAALKDLKQLEELIYEDMEGRLCNLLPLVKKLPKLHTLKVDRKMAGLVPELDKYFASVKRVLNLHSLRENILSTENVKWSVYTRASYFGEPYYQKCYYEKDYVLFEGGRYYYQK